MAGKEIHSSFTPSEVRLKRQLTRRSTIALTTAFLAAHAVPQNTEAASHTDSRSKQTLEPLETPTPTATSTPTTPTMTEQQPWQAISALGSAATAGALLLLLRQAKAAENTAKATRDIVEATRDVAIMTEATSRQAAFATLTSAYENIMTRGEAINETFIEHPELYNQLFETPHVSPASMKRTSDPARDIQLLATALRFADFFEITLDLENTIPTHARGPWRRYMKTSLKNSPYLRNLIKNTPWYGEPIKDLCREVEQEVERRFQRVTKLEPILSIRRDE